MTNPTLRESSRIPPRVFSIKSEPSLSAFKELCSRTVTRGDYPLSLDASSNVPIYDLSQLDSSDEELLVHLAADLLGDDHREWRARYVVVCAGGRVLGEFGRSLSRVAPVLQAPKMTRSLE